MPDVTGADLVLAIDFGTTATAAALAERDRKPTMVEIDNEDHMPSMVFWRAPDEEQPGELLLGKAADNWSASAPQCIGPTPKRELGRTSLRLGQAQILLTDVIAAILRKVWLAAIAQSGGLEPSIVCLTHPARWVEEGLEIPQLREAAGRAGLPNPIFMSEPEAAAVYFASERLAVGERVAVYDFGGGTLDTAVLEHTPDGFELVGRPGGNDHLGGEDFDDRLYEFLGGQLAPEQWERLRSFNDGSTGPGDTDPGAWFDTESDPEELSWSRASRHLRREARRAKEALSGSPQCPIFLPAPVDRDMLVNQDQLRTLIARDVEASVDELASTVRRSGLQPGDLAAVYLAGGSSQIPLVQALISEKLLGAPTPQKLGNAKSVVARGAATAALARLPRVEPSKRDLRNPRPDPNTGDAVLKFVAGAGRTLDRTIKSGAESAQAQRGKLATGLMAADAAVPQRLIAGLMLFGLMLVVLGVLACLLILSIPVGGAIAYSRRHPEIEGSEPPRDWAPPKV